MHTGRIAYLLYASGVNYNVNINYAKYLTQRCCRNFAFWKISAANLRILSRHLLTKVQKCVAKYFRSSNRWRKQRPNRYIFRNAILVQSSKKINQKCGSEFVALL